MRWTQGIKEIFLKERRIGRGRRGDAVQHLTEWFPMPTGKLEGTRTVLKGENFGERG